MDELFSDVRYALRQLRKTPLFSGVAIATLAIGIGATTAIFSTVNATLLRPLPFPRADQLVDVHTRLLDGRVTTGLLSAVEIEALRASTSLVAGVGAFSNQPFDATWVRDDGTPFHVLVTGVSEGFFDTLGLPPVRGRTFTHDEHASPGPDTPTFAIVSDRAWSNLFARDPSVLGKRIRIAEIRSPVTIVGVAPAALDLPLGTDLWINFRANPTDVAHNYLTVLRLRPNATIDQLRSAGAVAMAGLARTIPSDVGREYVLRPLLASLVGDLGPTLIIVFGATALLLVLACVNVTNLLLARGLARTREITVRAALGASRGRVVRQLLTESLVLATAGAAAGLALGYAAVRLMLVLGASKLPRLQEVPFDGRVLLFTVAVLLFTGVTMGMAPAWRLAGTDLRTLLNESGRNTTASRGASRIMSAMIVLEIALAIALVAGAGWLVQSFARLRTLDAGFETRGRLVLDVRTTRTFAQPDAALTWSTEMLNRLRAATGGSVGGATMVPLRPNRDGTLNIELLGEPPDPNRVRGAHSRFATGGFFEAMGIKLIAGRTFTVDDRRGSQPVAVVNRAFVRRYFPNADPLSGSFAYGYPTVDRKTMTRIVGVVDDARYKSLAEPAEPSFYLSPDQVPFPLLRLSVVIAARDGATPEALASTARAELKRFDPQIIVNIMTARAVVDETLSRQQLGVSLMLIFGGTALLLAAIGIYGVIADGAAQRRGEIATRLALGASARQVFWLIMVDGHRLAAIGLGLGLAAAYIGGRVVASSVFEMRAADPIILASAGAMAMAITFAATTIPAVRAARQNPVRALRSE